MATALRSGRLRGMDQTRLPNISTGKSNAYVWMSCGRPRKTAPVSTGEVRMRITSGMTVMTCSGRLIRSQYLTTGRNVSLALVSCDPWCSSCCRTGLCTRSAKASPAISRTGTWLIVADAAPVTMLVAPGPMEVRHAKAPSRLRSLA